MAKRQKVKKQHYVSAYYLRAFANGKDQLWVYDKAEDRSFPASVGDVTVQRYFYDIPADRLLPGGDAQVVEDALCDYEKVYANYHREVIDLRPEQVLRSTTAQVLAHLVATQYLRTPAARRLAHEITVVSTQSLVDDLVERNFGEEGLRLSPRIVIQERDSSLLLSRKLLDGQSISRFADALLAKFWTVWLNRSSPLFVTSDNPVSLAVQSRRALEDGVTPGAPSGVEVAFPLSPRYLLSIGDPPPVAYPSRLVLYADSGRVERFNRMQAISSDRYVIGHEDDFNLVRAACEEDPSLQEKDQGRVEVASIKEGLKTTVLSRVVNRHLKEYR